MSSGFSVVQVGSRYWLIQADPIAGTQDIDAYPGDAPWGPFDQAAGIVLYRDPGIGVDVAHDYRIMYEARVVPALSSSNALVISYNVNSIANTAGCIPMSWFTNTVTMPRFISVPLAIFNGPRRQPRRHRADRASRLSAGRIARPGAVVQRMELPQSAALRCLASPASTLSRERVRWC